MKEYLFRGKSLITGSMIYGNLFQREQQSFILTGGHVLEVLSETVGQYIGVTDMHGHKIFEGDILLDKTEEYQGMLMLEHLAARGHTIPKQAGPAPPDKENSDE